MKHIKRKTLNELELSEKELEILKSAPHFVGNIMNKEIDDINNPHVMLFDEEGLITRHFFFKNHNVVCTVPLANPILLYFNEAYKSYKNLLIFREEFIGLFSKQQCLNERSLEVFYNFFGSACGFGVVLYSSLEAFVNYKIPEEYIYHRMEKNGIQKDYNKEKIQKRMPLAEKIKCILNKIYGKSFAEIFPTKQQHIENLRNFRDAIVHTKQKELFIEYENLFIIALKFKYIETIEAVKDFINYYEKDLIEPCPCNNDY